MTREDYQMQQGWDSWEEDRLEREKHRAIRDAAVAEPQTFLVISPDGACPAVVHSKDAAEAACRLLGKGSYYYFTAQRGW